MPGCESTQGWWGHFQGGNDAPVRHVDAEGVGVPGCEEVPVGKGISRRGHAPVRHVDVQCAFDGARRVGLTRPRPRRMARSVSGSGGVRVRVRVRGGGGGSEGEREGERHATTFKTWRGRRARIAAAGWGLCPSPRGRNPRARGRSDPRA